MRKLVKSLLLLAALVSLGLLAHAANKDMHSKPLVEPPRIVITPEWVDQQREAVGTWMGYLDSNPGQVDQHAENVTAWSIFIDDVAKVLDPR